MVFQAALPTANTASSAEGLVWQALFKISLHNSICLSVGHVCFPINSAEGYLDFLKFAFHSTFTMQPLLSIY